MTNTVRNLPSRFFTTAVRLTRLVLLVITPLALLLTVLVVIGVGSLQLSGSADEVRPLRLEPGEYQIERNDGRAIDVAETTVFESDDGRVAFGTTRVEIEIEDDAYAIRSVAAMLVMGWLVLAWVGVNSLSGISKSLAAGERFTSANSRRIRLLGIVVLACPVVTLIGRLALRQMVGTLELAGPAVSVDVGVGDWWAWVVFGLLLVTLAELFAHGVELQELDEATI